jgi:hypothetical protein
MKTFDIFKKIRDEYIAQMESRLRVEGLSKQLEAANPFRPCTVETDKHGVEFKVSYVATNNRHFSAEGYDGKGKLREKIIMFKDMED